MIPSPSLLLIEENEGHQFLILEKFQEAFPKSVITPISNAHKARELLTQQNYDLILMNGSLAGNTTRELLVDIMSHQPHAALAILTDNAEELDLDMTQFQGVFEILTKDRSTLDSFVLKMKRLLSTSQRLRQLLYSDTQKEIESFRDPITQLYNRTYLQETLKREVSRANRHPYDLALLIVDLESSSTPDQTLKNPSVECLKQVASHLKQSVRSGDLIARYDNGQFVLVLTQCNKANALKCAQRILNSSSKYLELHKCRASIGVIHHKASAKVVRPKQLITLAEKALVKARKVGGYHCLAA